MCHSYRRLLYLLAKAKVSESAEGKAPLLLPHRPAGVDDAADDAVGTSDVLVKVLRWPGAERIS